MGLKSTAGKEWSFFTKFDIGRGNEPIYLRRYYLISTPYFGIYLHNIRMPDRDEHLHDHPWNFTSIILRGGYTEELSFEPDAGLPTVYDNWFNRFSRHSVAATTAHAIRAILPNTWTLVLVGKRQREWGFWVDGVLIPWKRYLAGDRI